MAAVVVLGSGRAAAPAASTTRLRVGVASCADQRKPQPIWDAVLAESPDFFVFAGDNVYASEPPFEVATLHAAYMELAAKPNFARLRTTVPHVAVWKLRLYRRPRFGLSAAPLLSIPSVTMDDKDSGGS